jgi:hypothetical protein
VPRLNALLARRPEVDPSPQALVILVTFIIGLATGAAGALAWATAEWFQHGCGS